MFLAKNYNNAFEFVKNIVQNIVNSFPHTMKTAFRWRHNYVSST